MKNIKFKAWDSKAKRMIPHEELSLSLLEPRNKIALENSGLIFLQFTDYFNENLEEVWEGDIYEGNLSGGLGDRGYLVKRTRGALMWQDGDRLYFIDDSDFLNLKKLGNKFENPELLKK